MDTKFYEENRSRLVAFFVSGEKAKDDLGRLGVEVEHHVVSSDGAQIAYAPREGRVGVAELLEHLSTWYPERSYNDAGDLLGLDGDEGSVTLEPAAQLEISIAPYGQVAEVAEAYAHFLGHANDFLEQHNAHLEAWGYGPHCKAQELILIPKARYAIMDAYFESIRSHGDRMMRGSASTQVSVDFADEADAVRKMRVAAALSPILAAIADNTPAFEGEPNHVPIRRLQLWREVDDARCGTPPHIFDAGYGYAAYAEWLLNTSPIFITRPAADGADGPTVRPFFLGRAADAYGDAPLSPSDVEHLTSMFWPDVRLKRFIEIRPADSLPAELVAGYTALIKGLFYREASLVAIKEELGVDFEAAGVRGVWPLEANDVDAAIADVQKHGFDGMVYGKALASWEELLFSLARMALSAEERCYLDALEAFAADKPWWIVG